MYYISRNGQDFGPYDIQVLAAYVRTGQILKCDEAREQSTGEVNSVSYFLKKNKIKARVQNKGNIFSQFKDIGSELIFPKKTIASRSWAKERTLLILAAIGLLPTLLWVVPLWDWEYTISSLSIFQ